MQASVNALPVRPRRETGKGRVRSSAELPAEELPHPKPSSQAPFSEQTDVELLTAFRSGAESAFTELYFRYKSDVYTFCLRMLGGNSAEAGDAFQETFIRVYERAGTFTYGENVRGWIYMIARNVSLNIYRTKRPEETIELHQNLENTERSYAPDFNGEQRTLREALEKALAQLPHEFREPFILRELDGLSYPEISEIIGITMGLVKIRIHRAKQRLRIMLAPIFAEEMSGTTKNFSDEKENEI